MLAVQIKEYKQEKVDLVNLPVPKPGAHDVLVEIHAASINPIDLKTKDGDLKLLLSYDMPMQMGSDFAGVVIEVGSEVTRFKVGDEVYGRVAKDRLGTFAEYIAVDEKYTAKKPKNITFEQAAGIPLVGLTSHQVLYEEFKLKDGDKVFIPGGSGGIGTIAIQLAKLKDVFVATTTSSKNESLVKELGADLVIDYKNENFEEILKDYDYVFDTRGGDELKKEFEIVKPGGKIVTIAGLPDKEFGKNYGLPFWKNLALGFVTRDVKKLEKKHNVKYIFHFMRPDGIELEELTKLIEEEKIKPIIDIIYPLEKIQDAIDYSASGRAKGKIIIQMPVAKNKENNQNLIEKSLTFEEQFQQLEKKETLQKIIQEPFEPKNIGVLQEIWKDHVPEHGQSDTLHGEMLRQVEKLRTEAMDNGNINWDEDFRFFCDFLKENLNKDSHITTEKKEELKLILDYIKLHGNYAWTYNNTDEIAENEVDMKRIAYMNDNLYNRVMENILDSFIANGKKNIPYEKNPNIAR